MIDVQDFRLHAGYKPGGDQPAAIRGLVKGSVQALRIDTAGRHRLGQDLHDRKRR